MLPQSQWHIWWAYMKKSELDISCSCLHCHQRCWCNNFLPEGTSKYGDNLSRTSVMRSILFLWLLSRFRGIEIWISLDYKVITKIKKAGLWCQWLSLKCYLLAELICYLVRTSNLQRLMIQESSNRMGNQPRTQTRSPGATFMSSLVYSLRAWTESNTFAINIKKKAIHLLWIWLNEYRPTCGLSETYLAQWRMSRIASMLVSGKAALHTNSDRHFTASWNESIAAAKCSWKVFTDGRVMEKRIVWTRGWSDLYFGLFRRSVNSS